MDGGMHVKIDGESHRLLAKFGAVLQDGGAQNSRVESRGRRRVKVLSSLQELIRTWAQCL
eukprot:4781961-Pyramimonas_sp.AAC.1